MTISASVGLSGRNRRHDVVEVQRMLKRHGVYAGRVDGHCGPRTARAILRFQSDFMARPDGRVDPGGQTWRRLIRPPASPGAQPPAAAPAQDTPLTAADLLQRVVRPDPGSINHGLVAVSPTFMKEQLGNPRESYSADCQPITDTALKKHVVMQFVGPFGVTGLRPAVDSLRAAFDQVRREQPLVYGALGSAGMLCCRWVRGSTTAISNHSWGTAIDLTLDGVLDRRGDDRVQMGLTLIASIMNAHGWYWGAAFPTEDAMHFEASRSLISAWAPALRGG